MCIRTIGLDIYVHNIYIRGWLRHCDKSRTVMSSRGIRKTDYETHSLQPAFDILTNHVF